MSVKRHHQANCCSVLERVNALLTLTTLVLLSACQRAVEAPAPEIRPVRVITVENRPPRQRVADRHRAGPDRDQPVVPHRRPPGRAHGGRRRHGQPGPADRPARPAERGKRPAGGARRSWPPRAPSWSRRATTTTRMRDLVRRGRGLARPVRAGRGARKTAEAQVESAQAQVTLAENRLSYTRLVSDVAGVVTARGPRARRGGVGRAHDRAGGARRRARRGVRRAGADQGPRAARAEPRQIDRGAAPTDAAA